MLLERDSAIDDFIQLSKQAETSGKILLLGGEAGIGKTALLEYMRSHPYYQSSIFMERLRSFIYTTALCALS